MVETIEALVEGGKASAGPPLGPALGPMGVNIMQVINTINDKTKEFSGMKVPVKVIID
ncbi:MAG: 50S ribosomal protein L11, partial [Thermoplasmatales archaeon]|nr:50S ribosomal protein L11 [Thermoplasmatales archaeon]